MPAILGMQMAITQQKVATSMLKQSAQMQQAVVNMVAEASQNLASSGRGQIVNITA